MWRAFFIAIQLCALPAGAVTIDWVSVGDAGNLPDSAANCVYHAADCGSVRHDYSISKYEVTNAQYVEFLNAVADTDTYGLYHSGMTSEALGGITRSGSPGSYSYAVKSGQGDQPVIFVSWYDALRFTNWLHNGQPTGAQGAGTTETGAYTFTGAQSILGGRNAGAINFLPTENEWYKAAYYDAASASFFDYPAATNEATACAAPTATANRANCGRAVLTLTDVGAYTGSASPYGTLDQGGNVFEWNETGGSAGYRGMRGGDWLNSQAFLAASEALNNPATTEVNYIGFRVAYLPTGWIPEIPEPGTGLLVMTGLLGLATWRKRPSTAAREAPQGR